jgi:hypothetical protein
MEERERAIDDVVAQAWIDHLNKTFRGEITGEQ